MNKPLYPSRCHCTLERFDCLPMRCKVLNVVDDKGVTLFRDHLIPSIPRLSCKRIDAKLQSKVRTHMVTMVLFLKSFLFWIDGKDCVGVDGAWWVSKALVSNKSHEWNRTLFGHGWVAPFVRITYSLLDTFSSWMDYEPIKLLICCDVSLRLPQRHVNTNKSGMDMESNFGLAHKLNCSFKQS